MVRKGEVGPIMLGRDHHDVSGTDSPLSVEPSNIKDGSNDGRYSGQCFAGNRARGMSLVALHKWRRRRYRQSHQRWIRNGVRR